MNPQQVAQSRSSANGFARRRGEKETGTRVENKFHSGKSNISRTITAETENKGGIESLSRHRLVYTTTCLIGHQVEVQVIDGSVFTGIFHATNAEKDFGIILKMARVTKAGSSHGQKNSLDAVQKPPSKMLIIPAKELVQIVAKSVLMTRDELMNELEHDQLHDIMIDSNISHSRHVDLERELEPWVPDDDHPECPELDNTFDHHWHRGWDQFEANATLFGVKSTFNEELYTTKLDRGPQMRELEKEALRLAREIEGEDTQDLHLAEERGIHFHDKFDLDEETKYSSVTRVVDDSGYDENEDVLDSRNDETFGDVSDSILSTSNDFHPSDALDGQSIVENNQTNQQRVGSNHTKDDTEKHMLYEQSQASKSEDVSADPNKESTDKGLSATATAHAPSHVSSNVQEKANSSEVSSTSESGNAAPASSGPGLSPSSSVGSLTSEKSTLNPHAKEFRFNPNAKSFVPLSAPLRAASPVSDASFYYPTNVGPVPHMHGMPVGVNGTRISATPACYFWSARNTFATPTDILSLEWSTVWATDAFWSTRAGGIHANLSSGNAV
ncbi:polyadenylate-binding protein-interacting protein 4-like isoform X3 [Helianthus annuus]|uniref:polyadenylate-binding protein-interacting protein 4-like isoform X3 n=1 Tax=Helianthus annuus TaxID=4232 RepID=UPI0016533C33|nr:polyadenylate-binding protein-interacting protein 4-like isoform X3 [Helianthus annuus]